MLQLSIISLDVYKGFVFGMYNCFKIYQRLDVCSLIRLNCFKRVFLFPVISLYQQRALRYIVLIAFGPKLLL